MSVDPAAPGFLASLRRGDFLHRRRAIGWGITLLIVEIVAVIAIAAGTYGAYVHLDKPSSSDFLSFFAAGRLADAGMPALAYDAASHYAMEKTIFGSPDLPYAYFFFYPPTFLIICAILALIPSYLAAFGVFIVATGALFVASLRKLLGDWRLTIAFLSFPALAANVGIGQNALLTAGLIGFGLWWVDRRPVVAGLLFGALAYKPHLAMMIPVALVAGRHWRALGAMAVAGALVVAISVLWFGVDTWQAFFVQAQTAAGSFTEGRVGFAGLVSLFAASRLLGLGATVADVVQLIAIVAAASLTALVWARQQSLPVRALTLIAAGLIAPPVILFYDLLPATLAIGWLLIDARRTGFLPWEKLALCAIWIVPILSRGVGIAYGVPLGPIATVALFVIAIARARNERAEARA